MIRKKMGFCHFVMHVHEVGWCIFPKQLKAGSDNELLTKMLKGFLPSVQYAAQIIALVKM